MRKDAFHIAAAVLVAGATFACSGRTERVDNPRLAQSGGNRGTNERIRLQGCVQQANPVDKFTLQRVFVPPPAEQPQGQETMEHRVAVPQGTWVRLTGDADELKKNLGKRVDIQGTMISRGETTIGTSGRTQDPQAQFARAARDASTSPVRANPPSTIPPPAALANGTAPEIAVEKITKISDTCEGEAPTAQSGK
jgi:hypothetical protein